MFLFEIKVYVVLCFLVLVVSASAINGLKRLISEMTCYVLSGTWNPTQSFTVCTELGWVLFFISTSLACMNIAHWGSFVTGIVIFHGASCHLFVHMCVTVCKRKLRFPAHQISWVSDRVIEYAIFLLGLAQQCRMQQKLNLAHLSLGVRMMPELRVHA